MTSEVINPLLPTPNPDDADGGSNVSPTGADNRRRSRQDSPASASSGSNDELSAILADAKPDPFLDPVSTGKDLTTARGLNAAEGMRPAADTTSAELAELAAGGLPASASGPEPAGSFDAVTASALLAGTRGPVEAKSPSEAWVNSPAAAGSFGDLDFSASPPSKSAPKASEPEEEEEEDDPPSRSALLVFLLASYSSAVTIGLVWVLVGRRALRETADLDAPPVAEAKVDPGRRAENSRRLTPPPSLAADRVATLGGAIRIGGLEVTPLEITSGPVLLRRAIAPDEESDGGQNALKLHLRLLNVSKDSMFAPLDEAFLREREAGVFDTFIELRDGQVIDMYPLSVFSEWTIEGQGFKELKPGESLVTQVVSAADALERASPTMVWRVRLRTGIEQTEVIGVTFHPADIKPGSSVRKLPKALRKDPSASPAGRGG